jgi:hypothetical protein
MSEYSDPPLVFDLAELVLSSGANVVLMEVQEFVDVPHLCSRQFDDALRKGALYVRSRGVAETVEVSDTVQMREVVELATQKDLRRFVETARGAGFEFSTGESSRNDGDETPFDRQRDRAFE